MRRALHTSLRFRGKVCLGDLGDAAASGVPVLSLSALVLGRLVCTALQYAVLASLSLCVCAWNPIALGIKMRMLTNVYESPFPHFAVCSLLETHSWRA